MQASSRGGVAFLEEYFTRKDGTDGWSVVRSETAQHESDAIMILTTDNTTSIAKQNEPCDELLTCTVSSFQARYKLSLLQIYLGLMALATLAFAFFTLWLLRLCSYRVERTGFAFSCMRDLEVTVVRYSTFLVMVCLTVLSVKF